MGMFKDQSGVLGMFENSNGYLFEYRPTTDPWAVEFGLPHEIAIPGGWLFGDVRKTVAKVAVDEADCGGPVIESWRLRSHNQYNR